MIRINLLNPSDFHRCGPSRAEAALLSKEELLQIRHFYDAALAAAARIALAGTPQYVSALKEEIEKRRPQIERIHRKAERRHKHHHPKQEE